MFVSADELSAEFLAFYLFSTLAKDLLALWGSHATSPASTVGSVREKNTPRSLWWYVMLLVLVAAVAESIVASRYLGTQREEA